jgi:CheY-like chemotaxis protein
MTRILVIDDDDNVRKTIVSALSLNGFDTTDVNNGDDAVKKISVQSFDLFICDLFMPEKDGIATILAIRKTHPKTPIILVTGGGRYFPVGGSGLGDLLKSIEFFGVTHFLMKPFRPSQLVSLVKLLLKSERHT